MTATTTPPVPRPPRPAPAPQPPTDQVEQADETFCAMCDAARSQHDDLGCGTFVEDHGR